MATTGALNAKNSKLTLNGTDISGSSNLVALDDVREVDGFWVFDSDWKIKLAGKRDWKGRIRAVYTETAGEAFRVAYSAYAAALPVPFIVSPKGGNPGDFGWSGNIVLQSAPIVLDGEAAGPILVEFPFEGTGELTFS